MSYLDHAVPVCARFEGFRARTYRDAVGVLTIGYGETRRDIVARGYITEPQARALLRRRLAEFGAGVDRAVTVPLNPYQHAALTVFAYNVGLGAFRDSTLLELLNRRQYRTVPAQLMRWTKAGGRTLPGLVTRRRAEGNLFTRRPTVLTAAEREHYRLAHKAKLTAARRARLERWLTNRIATLDRLARRTGWRTRQRGARRKALARALARLRRH